VLAPGVLRDSPLFLTRAESSLPQSMRLPSVVKLFRRVVFLFSKASFLLSVVDPPLLSSPRPASAFEYSSRRVFPFEQDFLPPPINLPISLSESLLRIPFLQSQDRSLPLLITFIPFGSISEVTSPAISLLSQTRFFSLRIAAVLVGEIPSLCTKKEIFPPSLKASLFFLGVLKFCGSFSFGFPREDRPPFSPAICRRCLAPSCKPWRFSRPAVVGEKSITPPAS